MTIINHKCYVSFDVAELLKEAGFNWECLGYYDKRTLRFNFVWNHNEKGASTQRSAPTLEVAQRWLREVKGMELDICWHINLDNQYKYAYAIKVKSIRKCLDKGKEIEVPSMDCLDAETCLDTYEEAQEAGIKKALEIILEKGE